MVSNVDIGPYLDWPRFPEFPASAFRPDNLADPLKASRWFYDWTVFTPEGLKAAEAYWDQATCVLESLLPPRFPADRSRWSGINLGTFTGAFQKAWMRLGYRMYGIELYPVIGDLHSYGCEGHQDNVFDLSAIGTAAFDFAVLDRVFCQKSFFLRHETLAREPGHAYFAAIRRILKDDGAFIGVLYDWYSRGVVAELASLGALKLWPMKSGRVGFRVDLSAAPSRLPDPARENEEGPYFANVKSGGVRMKWFLATNEILQDVDGRRELVFAPLLRESVRPRKPRSHKRGAPG